MGKKTIIIFRNHLLPSSETFIKAQGEGLNNYSPYYIGTTNVNGLELPKERVVVMNSGNLKGKVREALFRVGRVSRGLMEMLIKLNPVLIHAHFGPDGAMALPIARKLNVPLIVTFHGYDATFKDEYARKSFNSHRLYINRRTDLQRETRLFIAVSDYIKGKIIEQGFPEEKVIRHYIGIDTNYFTPDLYKEREPIVLFVARLVEKKGCEYFIRAMGRIQQLLPEVQSVFIGDGPLRSQLEEMASRTLIRYRFLGTQSAKTVREWMNKSKVFCVPSIVAESGDTEGFGMVFAEANAMGLPVVSFATGGITEAVAHTRTGFLAPEKDWQQLSFYILSLLEDELLWQQLSEKGKERVNKMFDLRKQIKQLENIYESVM